MLRFFNDSATTEIYTLSLHDALPISLPVAGEALAVQRRARPGLQLAEDRAHAVEVEVGVPADRRLHVVRSEEHTSELQSRQYLVCRLLLEQKKQILTPT